MATSEQATLSGTPITRLNTGTSAHPPPPQRRRSLALPQTQPPALTPFAQRRTSPQTPTTPKLPHKPKPNGEPVDTPRRPLRPPTQQDKNRQEENPHLQHPLNACQKRTQRHSHHRSLSTPRRRRRRHRHEEPSVLTTSTTRSPPAKNTPLPTPAKGPRNPTKNPTTKQHTTAAAPLRRPTLPPPHPSQPAPQKEHDAGRSCPGRPP